MAIQAPPENAPIVPWTDPQLARVDTLRLLSDPGYPMWGVSFCWGTLRDGTRCRVDLPFHQLPKGRRMKSAIIKHATADGVYAKRLCLLNDLVFSFLQ